MLLLLIGIGFGGYVLGIVSHKYRTFPFKQTEQLVEKARYRLGMTDIFVDVSSREAFDCDEFQVNNTMIVVIAGQSNAANYGDILHSAGSHVYNYFDGVCYRAMDPLLGASGSGGSVWTRLGDLIINNKLYDKVILANVSIGNSSISRWSNGGDLNDRLTAMLRSMKDSGLWPTHIFLHHGETDCRNGMSKAVYSEHLKSVIATVRDIGIRAPVYVAKVSRCQNQGCAGIRLAQTEVSTAADAVFPGPDTDVITQRFDACHISGEGIDAHAKM